MVHISEKQLEDWICEHPETVMPDLQIIGRQVPLEHGILDILGTNGMAIYAIELKAGPIKGAHIGQVLRYVHDINRIITDFQFALDGDTSYRGEPLPPIDDDMVKFYERVTTKPRTLEEQLYFEELEDNFASCRPLLIGTSIDPNTQAALEGAHSWLGLWSYDEDKHEIAVTMPTHDLPKTTQAFPKWVQSMMRAYFWGIIDFVSYIGFDSALHELFKMSVRTSDPE